MENANFATWTSVYFGLTNEVKVTTRSRSFQGQIVRCSLSKGKREVSLRLKGILVSLVFNFTLGISVTLFLKISYFSKLA